MVVNGHAPSLVTHPKATTVTLQLRATYQYNSGNKQANKQCRSVKVSLFSPGGPQWLLQLQSWYPPLCNPHTAIPWPPSPLTPLSFPHHFPPQISLSVLALNLLCCFWRHPLTHCCSFFILYFIQLTVFRPFILCFTLYTVCQVWIDWNGNLASGDRGWVINIGNRFPLKWHSVR